MVLSLAYKKSLKDDLFRNTKSQDDFVFNEQVADVFDERDDAVKIMLSLSIDACLKKGKYIGICGQGPSDHSDLADWLLKKNIESMSLNPDTVIDTWFKLAGKKI